MFCQYIISSRIKKKSVWCIWVHIKLLKSCRLRPLDSKARCMHFLFKKCLWSVLFAFASLWFLDRGQSSNCFFWSNSSKQCLFLENTVLKVQQKDSVVVQLWAGAISPFGFSAKYLSETLPWLPGETARSQIQVFSLFSSHYTNCTGINSKPKRPDTKLGNIRHEDSIIFISEGVLDSPSKKGKTFPLFQVFRDVLSISQ